MEKITSKEQLRDRKIVINRNEDLGNKILDKLLLLGCTAASDCGFKAVDHLYINNNFVVYKYSETKADAEEITPSQLLGETEEWEPKAGEWVVITGEGHSKNNHYFPKGEAFMVLSFERTTVDTNVRVVSGSNPKVMGECTDLKSVRPARPEEIPQEEVEYVECLNDHYGQFTKGKIYQLQAKKEDGYGRYNVTMDDKGSTTNGWGKTNFKPSTREAYEAQERRQECDCFDGCIKCKEVNKCSTINTNQNECKNESKSIEVRGSNISVGRSDQIRGKSFNGPESEITVGSRYRTDKGRSIEC